MYQTILVPLDGSQRAERILPHVEALAEKFGAQIILLQVIEPLVIGVSPYDAGSFYVADEIKRRHEEANGYLAKLQSQLQEKKIAAQAYWVPMYDFNINYGLSKDLAFTPHPDEFARWWLAKWK